MMFYTEPFHIACLRNVYCRKFLELNTIHAKQKHADKRDRCTYWTSILFNFFMLIWSSHFDSDFMWNQVQMEPENEWLCKLMQIPNLYNVKWPKNYCKIHVPMARTKRFSNDDYSIQPWIHSEAPLQLLVIQLDSLAACFIAFDWNFNTKRWLAMNATF